jgi:hypothetical protein
MTSEMAKTLGKSGKGESSENMRKYHMATQSSGQKGTP